MRWRGIRHTWERRETYRVVVWGPQGIKRIADPNMDKMIILKWILSRLVWGGGWINFTYWNQWWAVVKMVMNSRFHEMRIMSSVVRGILPHGVSQLDTFILFKPYSHSLLGSHSKTFSGYAAASPGGDLAHWPRWNVRRVGGIASCLDTRISLPCSLMPLCECSTSQLQRKFFRLNFGSYFGCLYER
jgi:hypothetical protein